MENLPEILLIETIFEILGHNRWGYACYLIIKNILIYILNII